MSYEDFVFFIISEEDKSTRKSIEYWFKVLDLDNNGILTYFSYILIYNGNVIFFVASFRGYEFDHFYEEQKQRLDYLNHEPVFLKDFLCQMADLFKPEDDIKYLISHTFLTYLIIDIHLIFY